MLPMFSFAFLTILPFTVATTTQACPLNKPSWVGGDTPNFENESFFLHINLLDFNLPYTTRQFIY